MSAKAELKHFYSQEITSSFEKKNSKHNFQNEKHEPKTAAAIGETEAENRKMREDNSCIQTAFIKNPAEKN